MYKKIIIHIDIFQENFITKIFAKIERDCPLFVDIYFIYDFIINRHTYFIPEFYLFFYRKVLYPVQDESVDFTDRYSSSSRKCYKLFLERQKRY